MSNEIVQPLAEVSNPYTFTLTRNIILSADNKIYVDNRPLVDLSYYAHNNISNWRSLTELPQENVDYLNSVRGTNMNSMFGQNYYYSYSINTIDASKWNTSEVIDMSYMFANCVDLYEVTGISEFNTSKVTSICGMFINCGFTTLDLSKWDISSVTDMGEMFYNSTSLTSLDLSNWDTSKVTNMYGMFSSCLNLTTVTGAIDMSSCTNCENMFLMSNLRGVHLKNVPRSLDMYNIGGTEGTTYIIDNYLD